MPKILVVDDSEFDRHLVGGLLRKVSSYQIEFAGDGAEALRQLASSAADLVITDLQMPGQNGLELVTAIREQYPEKPVVLITGHGSETLAIEALERGAAGYVPKSRLSERLLETVDEVLSVTGVNRDYERLLSRLRLAYCVFELDNDMSLFDPLVDMAQQLMAAVDLCDATGRFRVGVALKEALLNACYHGNLEIGFEEGSPEAAHLPPDVVREMIDQRRKTPPHRDRTIRVEWDIQHDEARFSISDQGPGFDVETELAASQVDVQGNRCQRGLVLMRTFMDEVVFNATGNQITLVKRRECRPEGSSILGKKNG
jgi:CheY-like chemotaxis protein